MYSRFRITVRHNISPLTCASGVAPAACAKHLVGQNRSGDVFSCAGKHYGLVVRMQLANNEGSSSL